VQVCQHVCTTHIAATACILRSISFRRKILMAHVHFPQGSLS